MTERLIKLLSVKSIVTIALTATFCALTINGAPMPEQFNSIYLMVIAFYFGTQTKDGTHTETHGDEQQQP